MYGGGGTKHPGYVIVTMTRQQVSINQLDFDIASMQYYFKAGTCQLPSTGMACIERHVSSEITLIRSRVMTQFLQALKEAKFASFRLVRESIKDHCL